MNVESNQHPINIQQEIHAISSLVTSARQDLAEGKNIDLFALESRVDELCRAIHDNPPQNTREVRQVLATIVNNLDALENELTEQHRQLEQGLAERTRKLAIEAYSEPDDNSGTKK